MQHLGPSSSVLLGKSKILEVDHDTGNSAFPLSLSSGECDQVFGDVSTEHSSRHQHSKDAQEPQIVRRATTAPPSFSVPPCSLPLSQRVTRCKLYTRPNLHRPFTAAESVRTGKDSLFSSNHRPPETLLLVLDQEGWRECRVVMSRTNETCACNSMLSYTPLDEACMTFNSSALQRLPNLRRVELGGLDLSAREASLGLRPNGFWSVQALEKTGLWSFEYRVRDKVKSNGRLNSSEKVSLPFECSECSVKSVGSA